MVGKTYRIPVGVGLHCETGSTENVAMVFPRGIADVNSTRRYSLSADEFRSNT